MLKIIRTACIPLCRMAVVTVFASRVSPLRRTGYATLALLTYWWVMTPMPPRWRSRSVHLTVEFETDGWFTDGAGCEAQLDDNAVSTASDADESRPAFLTLKRPPARDTQLSGGRGWY